MTNNTSKKYKILGMDCDACAKMIELDLEDQGIKAKCDFAKETLEVEIDDQNERVVKEIVEKGGYRLVKDN